VPRSSALLRGDLRWDYGVVSTVTLLAGEFTGVTAIVLGILAAVGGGLLGAWVTSWKDLERQRREIEEQARVRMLEAADAFVEAASAALAQLQVIDRSMQRTSSSLGGWSGSRLAE
jgi:hypothetical protein